MIKQPAEMSFNDKKFSMIIYGSPGLGKTTLALSAPDPILIDFDRGISRVKAYHRRPTIVCDTYEEVREDIKSQDVKDCKTLILDTGGSFITYLQDWATRTQPEKATNRDGSFSLKGYGIVKAEFTRFTNMLRDTMNKNVIYVFHSTEEKDKDNKPIQRLQCEGAARNLVWQPCDLGGYMQMIGNRRIITFTPEQEFFAKGCYGVEGRRDVPAIGPNEPNDFLTKLFDEARANIAAESDAFTPLREQYDAVMAQVAEIINGIDDADKATAAALEIPKMEHALTSKKEASAMLKDKTKELGLKWDSKAKAYKPVEEK